MLDGPLGCSLLDLIAFKQDLEDLLGCEIDIGTEAAISPYITLFVRSRCRNLSVIPPGRCDKLI